MDFQTPYRRIVDPGEPGGGGTKTVQSYVPASQQIMAMIEAGKRLDAYRADLYDYSGSEEVQVEPVALRGPGVDLVDVQDQVEELESRLAALRASAKPGAAVAGPAAGDAGAAAPAPEASAPAK